MGIQSVTVNSQQGAMKININRQSLQQYADRIDPNKPVPNGNICSRSNSDLNTSDMMINVSVTRNTFLHFMEDQENDSDLPRLSIVDSESRSSPNDIHLSMDKIPISNLESKVYKIFHRFLKNSQTNSEADCSECPV